MDGRGSVFVIMPFSSTKTCTEPEWTKIYKHVFKPAIRDCGYSCERARPKTGELIESIVEKLKNSAIVLADITDRNANVLYELGVRHSLSNRTIIVAQDADHIPSDLKGYWSIIYSPEQVEKFKADVRCTISAIEKNPDRSDSPVSHYLEHENFNNDARRAFAWHKHVESMKHLLLNNDNNGIDDYSIHYHCIGPVYRSQRAVVFKKAWVRKDAVTGGSSGCTLIRGAFGFLGLTTPGEYRIEKAIPYKRDSSTRDSFIRDKEPILKASNLYLLDAPIVREGRRKRELNWIMGECLKRLKDRFSTSVRMEFIKRKRDKRYPGESKKLCYYTGDDTAEKFADIESDYGFIVRAPNPFNERAIVLIMAGLHAPATHAATEVITIPERAARLRNCIEQQGHNFMSTEFFEAVFRVHRTYSCKELADATLEWQYINPFS